MTPFAIRNRDVERSIIPDLLVGLGLTATLIVTLSARHFPYQDATNHLARYVEIARQLWGGNVQDYHFRWIPSAYIAIDLVGAFLVRWFGAIGAEKIISGCAVALPVVGMYLLLRSTAPARRGWAVIASLLAFPWFLMAGLLNLVLGCGLVLCCLAWWWQRRDAKGWSVPAVVAGVEFALFFVHLWAALWLLVVLGAALLAMLPDLLDDGSLPPRDIFQLPILRVVLLAVAAFAAAWFWMAAYAEGGLATGLLMFRSPANKVLGLVSLFYVLSIKQAAFTAASYGTLLLIFLLRHGRRLYRDPFFVAAGLLTILYFVFPLGFGPTVVDTDRRWLLLAYYLPFCLVAPEPQAAAKARPERPAILFLALFLSLANTAVIANGIAGIDRKLDAVDAVLQKIPPGHRLLLLYKPTGLRTRVDIYGQYEFWYIIRGHGRVPGLWSKTMGDARRSVQLPNMLHFVAIWRPYSPYSLEGLLGTLDWRRIAADYDYILLITDDGSLSAEVGAHALPRVADGVVSLYRLSTIPIDRVAPTAY
jgi:hypothetical protein